MRPRKRIFIGLIILVLALLALLVYSFWGVSGPGLGRDAFILLEITVALFLPLLALGIAGMVAMLFIKRPWPPLVGLSKTVMDLLFPLTFVLGKVFGLDKERIESSFIELNNQLVRLRGRKVPPERILILLPHCLQLGECRQRITHRVDNCRRCGKCNVGEILGLAEEYGAQVAVATGGTAARRMLAEKRPKVVVAVACERDLSSGIHDAGKLAVLGVPNRRPHGPCQDTVVSPGDIRTALETLVHGGSR